jgi:acetyl esterase
MSASQNLSLSDRLRRGAGAAVVDNFFRGLSALSKLDPRNDPAKQGVRVVRDVPYRSTEDPAHRLDVFIPEQAEGPLPVVLYVHGGGFRILSKDTHFGMAMQFAKRGYLVFNINYRLAPAHPFPAAVEDACAAYRWVVDNAHSFDGDLDRLVLAGESAGANLISGLTIAACYERDDPWAKSVFDTGVTPKVTAAACGMLQVSNIERYTDQDRVSRFISDRLQEVARSYLPADVVDEFDGPRELDFANPLVAFERAESPARELPAFFLPVGTKDILLDDTRRLERALEELGAAHFSCYYPGEVHAFHAMTWRAQAEKCWRQKFEFLQEHLG